MTVAATEMAVAAPALATAPPVREPVMVEVPPATDQAVATVREMVQASLVPAATAQDTKLRRAVGSTTLPKQLKSRVIFRPPAEFLEAVRSMSPGQPTPVRLPVPTLKAAISVEVRAPARGILSAAAAVELHSRQTHLAFG